jgi:hypothetical protein
MFFKPRIFQKLLLLSGWSWFLETDAWRRDVVYQTRLTTSSSVTKFELTLNRLLLCNGVSC